MSAETETIVKVAAEFGEANWLNVIHSLRNRYMTGTPEDQADAEAVARFIRGG